MSNENDTLVNLLNKTLEYMSDDIKERIDKLKTQMVEDMMREAMPDYLTYPVPRIMMVQVCRKKAVDRNQKPTVTTDDTVFTVDMGQNYDFLPMFETTIIDVENVSIKPASVSNTWTLNIQTSNSIDTLSGVAFYFRNSEYPIDKVEIYTANGKSLPITMMSDFNQLPYVGIIRDYLQYGRDEQHYRMMQYWQDVLSRDRSTYCIVSPYDSKDIPLHLDANGLPLTVVVKSRGKVDLTTQKLMLNCFPIVNIEKKSISCNVTSAKDDEGSYIVKLPDMDKKRLVSLTEVIGTNGDKEPFHAENHVKVRQRGVKRDEDQEEDVVFLELTRPSDGKISYHIDYIVTEKTVPSRTTANRVTSSTSRFFDSVNILGVLNEQIQAGDEQVPLTMGRYYLQTKDHLITPADIMCFCKASMLHDFGYSSNQIKSIAFDKTLCKVDICVEGKGLKQAKDIRHCESMLESMIKTRTASMRPVSVNISYSCNNQ